jgi:hypothetical protein
MWVTSTGAESAIFSDRNAIVQNQLNGAFVEGAAGFILLSGNTLTSNGTGVASLTGGTLFSYKNNNINGNLTTDGTIPAANIVQQN